MKRFFVSVFLFLVLVSSPSHADSTNIYEAKNTPIAEFVRWFSSQTGQMIILSPGVSGEVNFSVPDLEPSEYVTFFVSVLRAHGYKLVEKDGVYTIQLDVALDTVQHFEPVSVKLYQLKHVRNTAIVNLMQSMLKATQEKLDSQTQVVNYDIQVLPTTNSIIVTGSDSQLQKVDSLIAGIDVRQKQVFIEALITETELNDNQEIGVNIEAALGNAGFITNTVVASTDTDNLIIFDDGNFSALVKAVQGSENSELLSRPNMLIMDRERGYITVGQNVPFIVSEEIADGGNTIQTIEREDVGVSLEVTPHIVGEQVVMKIIQKSSSVTNSAIAADIITNNRTLETVVKVRDGQTIALGGLISTEDRESVSGVPLLMDIPLLGNLFQSTGTATIKKELKIVIRTTVL